MPLLEHSMLILITGHLSSVSASSPLRVQGTTPPASAASTMAKQWLRIVLHRRLQHISEYDDTFCSLAALAAVSTRGGRSVAAPVPMGVPVPGFSPYTS